MCYVFLDFLFFFFFKQKTAYEMRISDWSSDVCSSDLSVDQLLTYFPNRKDPNLLMLYARLTDEQHAADVVAAINTTLAQARTELADPQQIGRASCRERVVSVS